MIEDQSCQRCQLSSYCRSPCLQGRGNRDSARLLILTDYPMWTEDRSRRSYTSDGAQILEWLLRKMGLSITRDVYLDYILKCCPGKKLPSQKRDRLACIEACSYYRFATLQTLPNIKAVVGMGSLTLEALIGSSVLENYVGENWTPMEVPFRDAGIGSVWITYSPHYFLEKKAEVVDAYRTIWVAALQAGLSPEHKDVPAFNWDNINK